MICAHCGGAAHAIPCSHCGHSPLVRGRYRLEHTLDRSGSLFAGTDSTRRGRPLSMMLLPVPVDQAEARCAALVEALAPLRGHVHPNLIEPMEPFVWHFGLQTALVLPQEPVPGLPLALAFSERRANTQELLNLLQGGLQALVVLHSLSPPLVHGRLGPWSVFVHGPATPVVVGAGLNSLDLMPGWHVALPAQGARQPSGDLFMLGITVLAAAVGQRPDRLLGADGAVAWNDRWAVHPLVAGLLRRMTRVKADERPEDARVALTQLGRVRSALESHPEATQMLAEVLSGPIPQVAERNAALAAAEAEEPPEPPLRPWPPRRQPLPGAHRRRQGPRSGRPGWWPRPESCCSPRWWAG